LRIVIDTNVFILGVFFGGYPRKLITAVVEGEIESFVSPQIHEEYTEIVEEMQKQYHQRFDEVIFSIFLSKLSIVLPDSKIDLCRDPDDNKFLECAKDSKALYIVSGDKDLLVLKQMENIQILTAKEFCDNYLK